MEEQTHMQLDIELLEQLQAEGLEASREVAQALDAAIANHRLSADAALCVLARLSATLIHKMQTLCPSPTSRDAVEDEFHGMLEAYLALQDKQDLDKEMERVRMRRIN